MCSALSVHCVHIRTRTHNSSNSKPCKCNRILLGKRIPVHCLSAWGKNWPEDQHNYRLSLSGENMMRGWFMIKDLHAI